MGNVLSSCLMLLPDWHIRMFQHGIVISAGLYWNPEVFPFWFSNNRAFSCCILTLCPVLRFSGCVKTSQLFSVGTKLMWRTGRWKPSRLHFTGRRTCNIMRSQPRAIITLKSLFFTLPENLLGKFSGLFPVLRSSFFFGSHWNKFRLLKYSSGL